MGPDGDLGQIWHGSGSDPHDLLVAQHALMVSIASALRDRIATTTGFERTLLLWRYEIASAALRFLDALVTGTSAKPSDVTAALPSDLATG